MQRQFAGFPFVATTATTLLLSSDTVELLTVTMYTLYLLFHMCNLSTLVALLRLYPCSIANRVIFKAAVVVISRWIFLP